MINLKITRVHNKKLEGISGLNPKSLSLDVMLSRFFGLDLKINTNISEAWLNTKEV